MPFRNVQLDIDDAIFQAALNRATREGKAISQVIAGFLAQYAEGASRGAPTTYTVQRGDTLGRIARTAYGDASKYPLIQRANNITDPSRIWVGQVLVIPPIGGSPAPAVTSAPAAAVPSPSPVPAAVPPPVPVAPKPATAAPVPAPAPPPTAVPPPLPPLTRTMPSRPPFQWVGSPNFNRRPRPDDITGLTIHSTANRTLEGVINWFNNPNAQVSAHYSIGKDGKIVQHVHDRDRAWHAGRSMWKGRPSCNDYCLGIELVNLNDGRDPYPEAQHQANVELCAYLCATYNISPDDIMGHFQIALPAGRKTDPRNYDLARLQREVAARLGG